MNFTGVRSLIAAICAILAMGALDFALSSHSRGSYRQDAPADVAFESAVTLSGFADQVDGKRNLLLVTVEALGVPSDPLIADRLFKGLDSPAMLARYDIARGRTRYFGTTTNAEIRELCGQWGNYFTYLDPTTTKKCLPERLSLQGYKTVAIHGFAPSFFKRDQWYPRLGLERHGSAAN